MLSFDDFQADKCNHARTESATPTPCTRFQWRATKQKTSAQILAFKIRLRNVQEVPKNPMGRFPKTAQDCCGGFPVPRNAPLPFKPVCAFPNTIFGIRGVEQRRRGEKRSFWPIMSTVIKQTSLKTRVSTSVFSTKEGHNVWGVTC